jgi:hypothetical protein
MSSYTTASRQEHIFSGGNEDALQLLVSSIMRGRVSSFGTKTLRLEKSEKEEGVTPKGVTPVLGCRLSGKSRLRSV